MKWLERLLTRRGWWREYNNGDMSRILLRHSDWPGLYSWTEALSLVTAAHLFVLEK